MTANAIKQERERRIIESARKHSNFFPPGTLVMADGPDGRIPSAALGIEVSELLPEKPNGSNFSHPQLASFQSEVVHEAARLFSGMHSHSADVLVFSRTIGAADAMLGKWDEHSRISLRTITPNNRKRFVCRRALVPWVGLRD